jgi:hypothetical protein
MQIRDWVKVFPTHFLLSLISNFFVNILYSTMFLRFKVFLETARTSLLCCRSISVVSVFWNVIIFQFIDDWDHPLPSASTTVASYTILFLNVVFENFDIYFTDVKHCWEAVQANLTIIYTLTNLFHLQLKAIFIFWSCTQYPR